MKKYKIGTQFIVFTGKYLVDNLGWHSHDDTFYYHDDFRELAITPDMLTYKGQTLTVDRVCPYSKNWYGVKENNYYWPVASFLEAKVIDFTHTCEEGMTPLDGWFICKICGDDLREIK